MNGPTTLERVQNVLRMEVDRDRDDFPPEARLIGDLGMDSLDEIEFVMAVEEEFGVDITDEEAEQLQTVGDVVTLMEGVTP